MLALSQNYTKCMSDLLPDVNICCAAVTAPTFQQPLFRHVTPQFWLGATFLPRLEQRQDP